MMRVHRRGRILGRVAVVAVAALFVVSCGSDPAEPSAPAEMVPADAPSSLNYVVKAGDHFVAYNDEWSYDAAVDTPLIATSDLTQWTTVAALPTPFGSVGFGTAADRLVITAIACEDGVTYCREQPGPLLAWIASADLSRVEPVEVPPGITADGESLRTSTSGTAAVMTTEQGPLVISLDGTAQLLDETGLDLAGEFGWQVVGSRLMVVGHRGDPNALRARAQLEYLPPTPELEAQAAAEFQLTSISYVELDDPNGPPTEVPVPPDASDVYPFLTPDEAVWIVDGHEQVLNLDTGEFTVRELPPEVHGIASIRNIVGGVSGVVSPSGEIYLTPDATFEADPAKLGIALRSADGMWSVPSRTPVPPTPNFIANDGLYAVVGSTLETLVP